MVDERIPDHGLVVTPGPTDMFRTRRVAATRDERTTRQQLHTLESGEQVLADFGSSSVPGLSFKGQTNLGFYRISNSIIGVSHSGVLIWRFTASLMGSSNGAQCALLREAPTDTNPNIVPVATDPTTGTGSAGANKLSHIAGSIEGQRITNSGNNITNDFDAGDNAAGNIGCLTSIKSATALINSSAGAILTAMGLIPAGCFLIGLTARITTSFGTSTGLTDFDVGDGSDVDRWANSLGITAGTTMDIKNATAATQGSFATANNVVLTAVGGNFDATGAVELIAHYTDLTAPTG